MGRWPARLLALAVAPLSPQGPKPHQYRAGGRDMGRTEAFARDLVAWKADIIISQMTNADIAVGKAVQGTDVPVVAWSTNLAETGAIDSFRRPGRNMTGFSYVPEHELAMIRIIKIAKPETKKIAILHNHTYAPADEVRRKLTEAAGWMGMEATTYEVLDKKDFEKTFAQMEKDGMQAVTVVPHELFNTNAQILGPLTLRHKLPMVACCQVSLARTGGLASFAPPAGWDMMSDRIDLILNGKAKPADLPVVRTVRAPLTLNLKSAKALGLTIPASLADEAETLIED